MLHNMEKLARLSNKKWNLSKVKVSNQAAKVVLLGDSMLKYTEVGNYAVNLEPWSSLLGTSNVFNYSTSGARIRNLWDYGNPTNLSEALAQAPDFTLVTVGANNRPDSDSTIISEYITLGESLETLGTPFAFSLVFPCTEAYRDTYNNGFNTRVPEIIDLLIGVCEDKGWEYVDLKKQLVYTSLDDNLSYMRADYSSDGLHLNNKGYKEFSKAIARFVNTKV